MRYLAALAVLIALPIAPALAQQATPANPAPTGAVPGMTAPAGGDTSASSQAFKAANERMMQRMNVPMTGNTDQDFVAGMIPHHQGAVDMAEVELKYGKDPAMRRLARNIIAAQNREIAQMKAWQAKHPPSQ